MATALAERLEQYNPGDADLIPFLLQNGARIIHEREGGLIECYVPVDAIDHEEVAVRQEWAESLAAQMRAYADERGGTGQKQTIGLGMIPGEPRLKISDGFHRDAALRINGAPEVYASAQKTNWDDLYDDRIILAKDHTQVRFTRVVEWMSECWQYSGFPDQMSITQALLLYRMKTSGKRLDVEPSVVKATSDWVARKEAKWGIAAMTMREYLIIAENVDPELVHATRGKDRGDVLEAPTQAILKIFSDHLPRGFDMQNLVMSAAMEQNLTGPQIRAVCLKVKGSNYVDASEIIRGTKWQEVESAYEETRARALRRAGDPRHKGASALQSSSVEIKRVIERTNQITERGDEVTPEMTIRLEEARDRANLLIQQLGGLTGKLSEIIRATPLGEVTNEEVWEKEPSDDELAAIEGSRAEPAVLRREDNDSRPAVDDGHQNGQIELASSKGTQAPVENVINNLMGENVGNILSYLMGLTDERPTEFTVSDLRKAWGIIDEAPKKPKVWQNRFVLLQSSSR